MVADLLTRIKNAQKARKEVTKIPYANFDFAVAELLVKNNYLDSVAKKGRMPKRVMEVKLKYDKTGRGVINEIKILSTPSRRLYSGYKEFHPVKQGYGLAAVSTPKGVMTTKEARRLKLGGQLLFEIW